MSTLIEAKNSKTKQVIFFLFLFLLLLPLLQMVLPFMKEERLNGVDPAQPLPYITDTTWFCGEYQKNYETTFEQNIGFHNSLVRVQNQINYSLFNFSNAGDVVVGKDAYIFLTNYINAYTGGDFSGSSYINVETEKTKFVQDELKKRGVDFFVVFAPGKGSFYSEYIPNYLKENLNTDSTNYAYYKKRFAESGVNNLDLKSYFLSMKDTSKYSLYSNTGVHWTEYGSYIAGREIVAYIEKLRKIKLPRITVQSIETVSFSGKNCTDYDAANLMNLFTTISHPKVGIPKLIFQSDSSTIKPHFLCISDSYFAGIINTDIPSSVFTDYHYWLYNDGAYPETFLRKKKHNKKELKNTLEKQDVVCLLSTDATLSQYSYGFIDEAYELFSPKNAAYYSLKQKEVFAFVLGVINKINKNKEWKSQLIANAKRKEISETDEFIQNALWLYNEEQLKLKNE